MADNEKVDAVDAFSPIDKSAGTQVIAQGDQGDHFYVVESGSLVIKVAQPGGGRSVRYGDLGPGDCFGELALMYNTPRAATIEATSDCKLWCLDRITYRSIVQHFEIEHKKQNLEFLKNVSIF
jgi:cAMP-dependent protein kinase regulator